MTQGTNGTVVNNNDGTVTYTPDDDFNGTDSYEYTVTSGGVIETATVNVTVNAVADGVADSFTTAEDTVLSDDVSTNDTFSAAATYSLNADASNGTVSMNANGTFTYTPDADFNGSDSFTYDVEDVNGDTETISVDLTVTPVVDIADDTVTVAEDGSTTDNLMANDSFEGSSPSITAVTQGTNGTVVNNNDGTVTYTPDDDFNGTDSYEYTVTSGGVIETATVNVTVNAVADGVADSFTTAEDTVLSDDVSTNDTFSAAATYSLNADASNGTVSMNANGTFTYTPDADFNGSDSFTYDVEDVNGDTETISVDLTVTPVVDIADDSVTTAEDTAVTTDVLGNDSFEGTPTVTGFTDGAHGTVVENTNGTLTYTPNADFNGTDSYTYTVTSGGVTETATVEVTVNQVNDPASFGGDLTGTGDEDMDITGTLTVSDTADGMTNPAFTVSGAASNGSASIDPASGAWLYTPNADYNGPDSFTVSVTDDDGNVETQEISLTVNAVADIVDDTATVAEDDSTTDNLLANDNFEGSPSITAVTQGTNGTVVNNNDGTVTYTPDDDFNGTDSYTYTVTSGGVIETATVNVTVNAVADGVADSFTTAEDTVLSDDVSTNDTFSAAATYSVNTDVSNGTLVLNGDGAFTYTPDADFNGSDSFTYDVEDVNGDTETISVDLTVTPVVDIADDTVTVAEDGSTTDDLLANDSFEGSSPSITAVTQGANGTVVNNNDGTVTYTPDDDFNGTDSYTYTVTSGRVTETATVNVTVTAVDDGVAEPAPADVSEPEQPVPGTGEPAEGPPPVPFNLINADVIAQGAGTGFPFVGVSGESQHLAGLDESQAVNDSVNERQSLDSGYRLDTEWAVIETVNRISSLGEDQTISARQAVIEEVERIERELAFNRETVGFQQPEASKFAGGPWSDTATPDRDELPGNGTDDSAAWQPVEDELLSLQTRFEDGELVVSLDGRARDGRPVEVYSVSSVGGGPLPAWLRFEPDSLRIIATSPTGEAYVSAFQVDLLDEDGDVLARAFHLDTVSGRVAPLDSPTQSATSGRLSFGDQLASRSNASMVEASELSKFL
ncbi:MAG: tandem-95 repeat protein [Gammaproteobacteria bacterium]|nr:tandem-95 repeat protein [Gammaproteobacteria bacterium]